MVDLILLLIYSQNNVDELEVVVQFQERDYVEYYFLVDES